LISLVSDEIIQGNPNKSNPHNLGFLRRNGPRPRKSKWTAGRSRRGPLLPDKDASIQLNSVALS
jgi:hypothetical protein